MKKLLKEVWKSFSKSKIILAGLTILIFLTSGIITLIFDVVNSYKTQFNTFKKESTLQDVTMNTSFSLYGKSPSTYYVDKKYEVPNQWEYTEVDKYANSISVPTNLDRVKLSKLIPSLTNQSIYVKTKDLSYLLNVNLNVGTIFKEDNLGNYKVKLNPTGNNNIVIYDLQNNEINSTYSSISNLLDTYDENNKTWSSSYNASNLFNTSLNTFEEILIDIETNKSYIKTKLTNATTSQEYAKYSKTPSLFINISSDDVAKMLGFVKLNETSDWQLDTSKNWILDGNITSFVNNTTASEFFTSNNNIPNIKQTFDLLNPITISSLNLSDFELQIPSNWFVYSKYKYCFTRHEKILNGVDQQSGNLDNQWTGYYKDYLSNLKTTNSNKFNELKHTSFWTKTIYVSKSDKNGNEISFDDENGTPTNISNEIVKLDSSISIEDLTKELNSSLDPASKTTIAQLENLPINEETVLLLNTNKTVDNQSFIETNAKNWMYNEIFKYLQEITSNIGIRENITINSTENNQTNVYQFINLGNQNNELNWNGINVKQEVGKLINTPNEMFNKKLNIDLESKKVPIKYISSIIEKLLLSGLSLNRDYINPMISFESFKLNNELIASSKIVWLSPNGEKTLDDIQGITFVDSKKTFYGLKRNGIESNWEVNPKYKEGFQTVEQLDKFIIENNLNFAPFDLYGNDLSIVSPKGWAKMDDSYIDKYSIPFQYLLPNEEILNNYNASLEGTTNPDQSQTFMQVFANNLKNSLTLEIKPLISTSNWNVLLQAVDSAFSHYGFIQGLTPPASISIGTLIKVVIGVFRDAITSTNGNFLESFFANIFDGLKRQINPGQLSNEEQQNNLDKQINSILKIVQLTSGNTISLDSILNIINQATNQNFTKISEIISNPSEFLDGIKSLISSINLDNTIIEFWNNFYENSNENNDQRIIGFGDFFPFIYKNVYSFDLLKESLKKIINSTSLKDITINQILDVFGITLPPGLNAISFILNTKLSAAIDLLKFKDPETGYSDLISKIVEVSDNNNNLLYKTLNLKDVLNLISINIGIVGIPDINLGTLPITNSLIELPKYNPLDQLALKLDMDLLWFLENYGFKDSQNNSIDIFGIDVGYFLTNAVYAFTQVKDDYNQITINENLGKLAVVNQAFLEQNNKQIYKSSTLDKDLNDLSKIDSKYKLNISGVEYLIIGDGFSVDYMYPVINSANMTVNTKTQALVYVNQYGYDRIKRSNTTAPTEKYFLFKTKNNQKPVELQTKLNQLIYSVETGSKEYKVPQDINSDSNPYKLAYLSTESSLLNPERSLRISVIDDMISNLELVQRIVGIMLLIIVSLVIIFIVRRYIGSRAKVLGILKAQGYSSLEIASSICLFPLITSIIGATLGYVVGLVSQLGFFQIFSIFWKIPIVTIPFNWLTFLITLCIPIILLCGLTILTTFWFLHKNKSIAMMNGSMEVNKSAFANNVRKLTSSATIQNKFSISLVLGSLGKLFAFFISTLFTVGVTLFFIVTFGSFKNSTNKSYLNKNYNYSIQYISPTIEGGNIQTYNLDNLNENGVNNMLYVPVGLPEEGYVYKSDYFKPGYNEIINKDGANGNISPDDTTTPHIFTKSSADLTVNTGGITLNVWDNLYNALPESQRASIIDASQKSSSWMEWTQEGKKYIYKDKEYITRFVNFNLDNEYLSLWDKEKGDFVKLDNKNEDVKISYFNFKSNNDLPHESKFVYKHFNQNTNKYVEWELQIDGLLVTNKIRTEYRDFLVNAYNLMFKYSNKKEISNTDNYLDNNLRTKMPEFYMDYFLMPGTLFLNSNPESYDQTFTVLETSSLTNENLKPHIFGYSYSEDSTNNIKIVDNKNNNLIIKANEFEEPGIYPLIINNVVSKKYGLKVNDKISFEINNTSTRHQDKLRAKLNPSFKPNNIVEFKIIGISNTYINEEWITSKEVANKILGLQSNSFNAILSKSDSPMLLSNQLSLYSENGYWSADNKIFYTNKQITDLSESEKIKIVNIYKQIFYNNKTSSNSEIINASIMANNLRHINSQLTNNEINDQIKQLFSIENLDLNFESGAIDDSINNNNVRSANEAIKKFVDIYTDNALSSYLINATSNGIEKEFIFNTSSTVNEVLIIVCIISFIISLTILIMISSMIITENEKNIAIFGILGYSNKEKIRMFFLIYLPIILFSTLFAVLIVWLILPVFVSTILSTTSILLSVQLSFSSVCLSILIVSLIFALTFGISWWTQGRIKPIVLLKGV